MSRFELDEALLMTDDQLHDRGKAALVRANSGSNAPWKKTATCLHANSG